ncbi:gldB [Flavobacterium cauense R2A-7]|uniref:Gliding motility-associated lipoprotein GldB n=1 Tax=Flavobacterium cauense R2A-7 TaxID=1341154 RepID=V6S0C5_9FLAO|nr:gliding motility lipoprotein GldB [Flavobacterium cauense]ESU20156.1 gldB [Flavobacterium cauense R2A-7]KGO83956.1 gliding motility protein GldB [Flavobacterium cauense R2A-7]TWI14702.1 gliding motility-associated lipoprotein GldB [Flavobacterium cauense R2A-7]
MKKYLLLAVFALGITSCKKEDKVTEAAQAIPVKVNIERFDKRFYESKPEELSQLKNEFPFFFPAGNPDTVWTNKMKNPLLRELYGEVKKKYPNNAAFEDNLEQLFKRIKFYYPELKTPKVIALISEVDKDAKAIYTDSLVLLSLDTYLGKDHRFYEGFPKYMRQGFEPSQMMPDLVSSFSQGKIAQPTDRTLLAQMIYFGKELYMKDMLLPDVSDAAKIEYTDEQIQWCKENESEMWKYFINNKLLYDTDVKLMQRFVAIGPYSKFYLEIDNESPGRVGQWLGWQIVRSYMENNDVSMQKMLAMDAKEIFDNSKYKPKK